MDARIEIPTVHSYEAIRELARQRTSAKKVRAVLVAPHESETLPAFARASAQGFIDPTIIGDEKLFRQSAAGFGGDPSQVKVIDINQPDMALRTAAKMAQSGEIDIIVQGRIEPDRLVSLLAANEAAFIPSGRVMSHIGIMKTSRYPKLLLITDGLVHEQPDLATKVNLLGNLARAAKAVRLPDPRTAVVTAVEAIYPQMSATTDGAVLAKMFDRGQIKGVRVDGPLSFDIAVDFIAAESKGIRNSIVAGQADAILASTRYVAQGVYQAMSLYCDCECGGVLVGGHVPVAANFVSDSQDSRFNSILLACLMV